MNYYNEYDRNAAAWLRELIRVGEIPDGVVDERSILDVRPDDLRGFVQCHFFAGIGGRPYALRLAGWPANRPVWTGSCPCQPFSAAGKQLGTADERHLWPVFRDLIAQCQPARVFGEQVASAAVIGHQGCGISTPVSLAKSGPGPDAPRSDEITQERAALRSGQALREFAGDYRRGVLRNFGAPVQSRWRENMGQPLLRQDQSEFGLLARECSSGVARSEQRHGGLGRSQDAGNSAFDPRAAAGALQRAIRMARAEIGEEALQLWLTGIRLDLEEVGYAVGACNLPAAGVGAPHIRQRLFWMADTTKVGRKGRTQLPRSEPVAGYGCPVCPVADTDGGHASAEWQQRGGQHGQRAEDGGAVRMGDADDAGSQGRLQRGHGGNERSAWAASVVLPCTDGKARRIEPRAFPLAHGIPGRVGLLRGYGNAIVPQVAAEFIRASEEACIFAECV